MSTLDGPQSKVIGVIAGRGEYPILLAERLVDAGKRVAVAGIRGQFRGGMPLGYGPVETFPLGAISATARFLRQNDASLTFMAGGIRRAGAWRSARPDLRGLFHLPRALFRGDDYLLRAVAAELARLGVSIGNPSAWLEDLFAGSGPLAGPEPDATIRADIEIAWNAARDVGRADRGQAVVVHRGRVVGREGRAGTDALLAKAPGPGAVLAKTVKPGQDRRFDMPAIGPSTVRVASMVGVRAIAVEANGVLLLRKQRVIELCDARRISLVGVSAITLRSSPTSSERSADTVETSGRKVRAHELLRSPDTLDQFDLIREQTPRDRRRLGRDPSHGVDGSPKARA